MICDLAETYHILNYEELLPELVATLVLGLNENSRVKKHFNKQEISIDQILLAIIADNVQFLAWSKTKDAMRKKNRPKSILKKLMGTEEIQKEELEVFNTIEEYEAYMKTIHEEQKHG